MNIYYKVFVYLLSTYATKSLTQSHTPNNLSIHQHQNQNWKLDFTFPSPCIDNLTQGK